MSAPAAPRLYRRISIRAFTIGGLVALALYVGAMAAYFGLRLRPGIGELGFGGEALTYLLVDLGGRAELLDSALVLLSDGAESSDAMTRQAAAARIAALLERTAERSAAALFGDLPAALRRPLTQADDRLTALHTTLSAGVAVLPSGDLGGARRLQREAAVVRRALFGALREAQVVGVHDLVHRQQTLLKEVSTVTGLIAAWLGGLMVLAVVAGRFVFRRVVRPVGELGVALRNVAAGDLHVQLAVRYSDEIAALCEQFNEMTRVLRERAAEQGRFVAAGELIAGVAHEVNNPLMAISAIAATRLEDTGLPPEYVQELQTVMGQAKRAGKLIAGLLRFIRAEDRAPERTVDLAQAVREAVDLVSYRFAVEQIKLEASIPDALPVTAGSRARVEQVIVNLVSNAVDALSTAALPRLLKVDLLVRAGAVEMAVEDTGGGIDSELRTRLFRPFVSTKGRHGTGLGLYISRQIARDLGGDLVLDSGTPGRTRFVLSLPVADDQPQVTPGPPRPSPGPDSTLQGISVLVVDDEPAVRRPIVRYLTRRGATVREAADGRAALDAIDQCEPDVVLTDLKMPIMSGVELYATLCAARPHLTSRVIVLSGDLVQLEELGGTTIPSLQLMLKPADLSDVEQRIGELLVAQA